MRSYKETLWQKEEYLFFESGIKEIKMSMDAVAYKVTVVKLRVGKGACMCVSVSTREHGSVCIQGNWC